MSPKKEKKKKNARANETMSPMSPAKIRDVHK